MGKVVYAVPGVTPKGEETSDLNKARATARAHGVHVFAYSKGADGSLRMLGSQSPNGRVIKYEENPFTGFSAPPFHQQLRLMGLGGHTVYRDLKTGVETKKPKMVYFGDADAALQALAVFLVLEGVDTRGAEDISNDRTGKKMAAIRLPNGDIYSATLSPEGNDYWIQAPGLHQMIRWGSWARAGQYPTTKAAAKKNPRSPNYGYWVHIRPDKTFSAVKTGPGRAKYRETAEQYLRSQGLNPAALQRGGFGLDYSHGNERGPYYWDTPAGRNILSFYYDLDYISKTYMKANPRLEQYYAGLAVTG